MPTPSKIAKEVHDQYFTSVDSAEWCLSYLRDEVGWDLTGTALEPCVGRGSFVQASRNLGLDLEWVTNDLYPSPEYTPDTQVDIRVIQPEAKPDYVITNPPFGNSNSLARTSLKRCLTVCDRVAMVLPKGSRRIGFLDAQPPFAHLIADTNIPDMQYVLPTGEVRSVKTCFQVWEVTDTKREKIRDSLDLRTDLIYHWGASEEDYADNGHGLADFQVCRWGGSKMNVIQDRLKQRGSWMSVRVTHPEASIEEVKDIISSVDVSDYLERSTSLAAFDPPVWLDRVNREAVRRGWLPEKG